MADQRDQQALNRFHLTVSGIVQGVGFRPFVFRLAHQLNLTGWVRNTPAGVEIEIQGRSLSLPDFEHALSGQAPPLAEIASISSHEIPTDEETSFSILPSSGGIPAIQIAPDSALCDDCRQELFDPNNRRYRYPFITCTNCGPRYSIITGIPYDRPNTTMSGFVMCRSCLAEYHAPHDRRFHAQPNACPECGPQVRLVAASPPPTPALPLRERESSSSPQRGEAGRGEVVAGEMASGDVAIRQAVELLQQGHILAVKGISGYHLAVSAFDDQAVELLRSRKKRDHKPFAVMAADLATARKLAVLSEIEERLLTGQESPVVIVAKRDACPVAPLVAPGNGWLGLLLPYAPLHHLLFHDLSLSGGPTALVMTSANNTDEPTVYQDEQALESLGQIADYFLIHNRPIHIRSDDSVMRVFQGKPLFYRRARGYAPRTVNLPFQIPPLLAVGAELKNAVCLASGGTAFLSQHIGDLQNSATCESFHHTIAHLTTLLEIKPQAVACDLHPDYLSTIHAAETGLPLITVQHHHAHMAACMAENGLEGKVIGVILDGTGYGSDSTIWGGEFLVGGYEDFERLGHLRPLPLPGGDQAVHQPWRMALAYLYQALGKEALTLDLPINSYLTDQEKELFCTMLVKGLNSPLTSSCGRLFDAVAALLDVKRIVSYDGQAAIELEALAETVEDNSDYPYEILPPPHPHPHPDPLPQGEGMGFELNFAPIFPAILSSLKAGVSKAKIARQFHNTVATAACDLCVMISDERGLKRVVLSGGVFQNRLLSEMIYTALSNQGLQVFTHRLVPPNDGGIALGQAAVAGLRIKNNYER